MENNQTKKLSRSQMRRRQDILDASLAIFDRDGFDAAKMEDIAAEAEVAKGTLYLYFDSKAALLEGVIQSAIIPTIEAADSTARAHVGSSTDLLKQQMKIMAQRMVSPEMRTLLRYMMSGNTENHKRIVKFYFENVVQTGISLLGDTINKGVKNKEFRKDINGMDPLVLLGSQIYMTVWKILFEDFSPIDIDLLNEDLLQILLDGMKLSP